MSERDRQLRAERVAKRDLARLKEAKGDLYDPICSICHESVEKRSKESDVVVTLCDHVFHRNCMLTYSVTKTATFFEDAGRRVQQEAALARVGAFSNQELLLRNSMHIEVANLKGAITISAGPSCPMCRQGMPLVHELAADVLKREWRETLPPRFEHAFDSQYACKLAKRWSRERPRLN